MSAVVAAKNSFGIINDIETSRAFSNPARNFIMPFSSFLSESVPPFSRENRADFASADSRETILRFLPSAKRSTSVNARCRSVKNSRATFFVSENPTAAPTAEKFFAQTKSSVRFSLKSACDSKSGAS